MFEWLVLGFIQGLTEWIPVSSDGMIMLAAVNWFGRTDVSQILLDALLLHIGTWFAALIYFRKDVWHFLVAAKDFRKAEVATQKTIMFILVATIISGVIGLVLLKVVENSQDAVLKLGRMITFGVGMMLIVTGGMQLKAKEGGTNTAQDLTPKDHVLLGVVQGLAALPGLSRSGFTVTTLILRKFTKAEALRLSFLLSLPIVLLGNIGLNLNGMLFTPERIVGILAAFASGFLTIKWFMQIAEKVNFGKFVIGFGILTILAALL